MSIDDLELYEIAIIVSIADLVVGSISAVLNEIFYSKIFKKGLFTHTTVIAAILIMVYFKPYIKNFDIFFNPLFLGYIGAELVSILETLKTNGLKLPSSISRFINVKEDNKKLLDTKKRDDKQKQNDNKK